MTSCERINWIIVAVAMLASGLALLWAPFDAAASSYALPIGTFLGLATAGHFYRRRSREMAASCIGLAHIVGYTACYTLLMYAAGASGRPFIDANLAELDQRLGISLPDIVAWAAHHHAIAGCLNFFYDTMILQTAAVIALLGLGGRESELQRFMLCFFLSTAFCLIVFFLWPAAGPFEYYGYSPSDAQLRYLIHLDALRNGSLEQLRWSAAEGLITFPSFHTTWALLLIYAIRRVPIALLIMAPVNIGVIAATLTTGWHYGIDVVGGAALATATIAVIHIVTVLRPVRFASIDPPQLNSGISRPSTVNLT